MIVRPLQLDVTMSALANQEKLSWLAMGLPISLVSLGHIPLYLNGAPVGGLGCLARGASGFSRIRFATVPSALDASRQ